MNNFLKILLFLILIFLFACGHNSELESSNDYEMITETITKQDYKLVLSHPAGDVPYGNNFNVILQLTYPIDEKYILLPLNIEGQEGYALIL